MDLPHFQNKRLIYNKIYIYIIKQFLVHPVHAVTKFLHGTTEGHREALESLLVHSLLQEIFPRQRYLVVYGELVVSFDKFILHGCSINRT